MYSSWIISPIDSTLQPSTQRRIGSSQLPQDESKPLRCLHWAWLYSSWIRELRCARMTVSDTTALSRIYLVDEAVPSKLLLFSFFVLHTGNRSAFSSANCMSKLLHFSSAISLTAVQISRSLQFNFFSQHGVCEFAPTPRSTSTFDPHLQIH